MAYRTGRSRRRIDFCFKRLNVPDGLGFVTKL